MVRSAKKIDTSKINSIFTPSKYGSIYLESFDMKFTILSFSQLFNTCMHFFPQFKILTPITNHVLFTVPCISNSINCMPTKVATTQKQCSTTPTTDISAKQSVLQSQHVIKSFAVGCCSRLWKCRVPWLTLTWLCFVQAF